MEIRTLIIVLFFLLFGAFQFAKGSSVSSSGVDTLKHLYKNDKCGLNYFTKSAVIGKRMEFYGLPFPAQSQPVNINVNELTLSSKVLKTYVWWVQSGDDSLGVINIQTPDTINYQKTGVKIGEVESNCWGNKGVAFRLDASNLINKNGDYKFSGLLTDTTFDKTDVDGFTVMVIYEDTLQNNTAGINVYDGFVVSKFNAFEQSLYNFYTTNQISEGKSFMLLSDYQNEPGTKIKLNSTSYNGFTQHFWDFYETPSYFVPGKSKIDFGIQSPNDCGNIIAFGSYIKSSSINYKPVISSNADTLYSSNAINYQWLFNNSAIENANDNHLFATINGNYQVIVGNDSNNCYSLSDVFNFKTCNSKHKPNIYIIPPYLKTDSLNGQLKWYSSTGLIDGVNTSSYAPSVTDYYYLSLFTSNDNCLAFSDTIQFKVCKDFMKPNIKWQNNLLKTDSVTYSLQWFLNGNPIANANSSSYNPTTNGVYWVSAFNPDYNCGVQSDSFVINFIGFGENYIVAQLNLIENPVKKGEKIKIKSSYNNEEFNCKIYDISGTLIFNKKLLFKEGINVFEMDKHTLNNSGLYLLELNSVDNTKRKSIKLLIE